MVEVWLTTIAILKPSKEGTYCCVKLAAGIGFAGLESAISLAGKQQIKNRIKTWYIFIGLNNLKLN
jgi:hypothetical protein